MLRQRLITSLPPAIYVRLKYWDYRATHKARFKELQAMRTGTIKDEYSYKPFDDTKSIFVHIPKCAGVAVNRALFGNLAGGHATLNEYLTVFEPRHMESYFKFTIVRNPWDRLVSAFFFLKSGGFGQEDRTGFVKEFGNRIDFRRFVKSWVNKTNIWRWHHFRPQYHYMLEAHGKIHLDFVAFLENIDADFSYIAKHIGIDCALAESNKSQHISYMHYYDDETRNIVANAYAEDIKMLGYNFDSSSLDAQLLDRKNGKVYSLYP